MQPNSPNKQVMDVAPAKPQPAPAQLDHESRPDYHSPQIQDSQNQLNAAKDDAPDNERPDTPAQKDQGARQESQKPKSNVPVGVITATVFIMLILIGTATIAYLAS